MKFEVSVAPMVGVSTPEYRKFMQIVSPGSLVFTEMVVDTSLIYMSSSVLERKIGLPSPQCVLQVGGSNPESLSKAVARAVALGYRQVNLNCGCPSDRVQSGRFGAVLMKRPKDIAEIVQRVYVDTGVVMSVKCRVGVDNTETYATFKEMVQTIAELSPCRTFYVHARSCLLNGLSPAENRSIPPLKYHYVFQLKKDLPHLRVILNGGLRQIEEIAAVRESVDGVMLGRKPMDDPMFFARIEESILQRAPVSISVAIQAYLKTLPERVFERERFFVLDAPSQPPQPPATPEHTPHLCTYADLKPIEPALHGQRGCKEFKRTISELARRKAPVTDIWPSIKGFVGGVSVSVGMGG
ncbi:tRNA-dihydrouridine synthase A [Nematocida displodere]|uniref:tRNA-dihydrouridine synthase A n=1 Tax=Nematocida displodere TaxID=1805483 RepID=A0A177EB89_9MICR|nr:tRNA-dihydrouridine synthase A [Nematocida displodere]